MHSHIHIHRYRRIRIYTYTDKHTFTYTHTQINTGSPYTAHTTCTTPTASTNWRICCSVANVPTGGYSRLRSSKNRARLCQQAPFTPLAATGWLQASTREKVTAGMTAQTETRRHTDPFRWESLAPQGQIPLEGQQQVAVTTKITTGPWSQALAMASTVCSISLGGNTLYYQRLAARPAPH